MRFFGGPFSLACVVFLRFSRGHFWDVILGIFWGNFGCFGAVSMTFGPPSGVSGDAFWGSGRSSEAPGAALWETLRVPGAVWGDPWIPRRFVDASGTISGKFREISGSQQGVILPSFCASFFHQKISEKLCCFRAPLGSLLSFILVIILTSFFSPFVS